MITRTLTVIIAVLFGTSLLSGAASHTDVAVPPSDTASVCTVGGVDVRDGEELPKEMPHVISCFDTEVEALAFIENGAPGDLERLLAGSDHLPDIAQSTSIVTIGMVWKGTSRSGAQLIHWGTGSGCYGVTYGFPSLPSGWNNAIRSSEGFSNCWVTHYSATNYGGTGKVNCTAYCSTMGPMDQNSSSIVYRPVGTLG